VILEASPDSGYRVKAWIGTDNDNVWRNINTITMYQNTVVTVEFEIDENKVFYVKPDTPGQYQTIDAALADAGNGDEIVVWPGTYTLWNDRRMIIHQARPVPVTSPGRGVFTYHEGLPAIGTADGILVVEFLQLAGKKKLAGNDFLHGISTWP